MWAPVVVVEAGWINFLWICDLANFLVLAALWTRSRLLFSSQLVSVMLIDLCWIVDVVGRMLTGEHMIGGTEYMFDAQVNVLIRLGSLFHVFVPAILVWAFIRYGYHRRGIIVQTLLTWAVLPVTYLLTPISRNINWVFGPFGEPQTRIGSLEYLALVMVLYPVVVYLPVHALARVVERRRSKVERA